MACQATQTSLATGLGCGAARQLRLGRMATHTQDVRCRSASVRASSEPVLKKPVSTPEAAKPETSTHAASPAASSVTIEFQRQQAKEMQKYFRRLALEEEVAKAQVFGWTKKNEISNGRWVMFGLMVGMLTEYATGVSFIDQLRMIVSFLGIADIYD